MSFLQKIISVSRNRGGDCALVDSGCSLNYSQFRLMSNILAHRLRDRRSPEQGFVALLLPRTVYFPAAAVGVLKAGYAFVPMSAGNSAAYNLSVLSDSEPFAIISTSDVWNGLPDLHAFENVQVILMDELLEKGGLPDDDIDLSAEGNPGMLIYTSGTTGHPKAVLHSLGSLSAVCEYSLSLDAGVSPERFSRASVLDFCFLAGVLDLFAPLMAGGKCHIVPDSIIRNIDALCGYLNDNRILGMTTIGAVAAALVRKGAGVRTYMVTGGCMPVLDFPLPSDVNICNTYGMTECGACLSFPVRGMERPVPIGRAVDGVRVYLLDDGLRPVPDGCVGEICVCSPALAMGYFHNEALTRDRFVDCPFEKGVRMFRTGDYGRVLPTGDMLYCGRRDDMVKVRGVRIHTAEVENAAISCGGVRSAVAVLTEKGILCLFYAGKASSADLIARLKCELPALMMPGRVVRVDSIPLNSHGKVDRDALIGLLSEEPAPAEALDPVQERVLSAMRRVLGSGGIGLRDDFFDFGGDSLNVVTLLSELPELPLTVETVYRERTAERIAYSADSGSSGNGGGVSLGMERICLSPFQKRVLESQLAAVESVMWNNPVFFRLGEDCDKDRLLRALQIVARHHPILSCVPDLDSGSLRYVPLRDLPIDSVQSDAWDELVVPFPLSGAPMWRIRLLSSGRGNYLFMDFHHLIFDGTSLCVFMENLRRAYCGETLPADNFFRCMESPARDCRRWSYPLSKPVCGAGGMQYLIKQYSTALSRADVDAARARSGFSLDVYAVAAAGIAVGKFTGSREVAVNWMYSNRVSRDHSNSFGAYVRMFTVFMDLEDRSCAEILDNVRSQIELILAGGRGEYVNDDAVGGSDPVLINNLTGLDLDLERFPFDIERVEYDYCIREFIEYLDVELFYDEDSLCLDMSCGSRNLVPDRVSMFGNMIVSCLEKLMMV